MRLKYLCFFLVFSGVVMFAKADERLVGRTHRARQVTQNTGFSVRYYDSGHNSNTCSNVEKESVSTSCPYCLNKIGEPSNDGFTIRFYSTDAVPEASHGKAETAVWTISYFNSGQSK